MCVCVCVYYTHNITFSEHDYQNIYVNTSHVQNDEWWSLVMPLDAATALALCEAPTRPVSVQTSYWYYRVESARNA